MEPVYGQKGWLPDPDKPGYLKYDDSRKKLDPNNPDKMTRNYHPDFVSDHDKAVIEEARIRRKLMEDMLKERGIEVKDSFKEYTEPKKNYEELVEEIGVR